MIFPELNINDSIVKFDTIYNKWGRNMNTILNNNNITKIIHLADIHIRRSEERHAEYQSVFDKLYESLKQKDLSSTVIVLCGDILHEKKGYSKESLQLSFNLFNNLRIYAPVIVIMGNHDGLIDHKSNYDQLDVIINQVNSNNFDNENDIYYLKYSGVYSFNNIDFHVSSCLDKLETPSYHSKTDANRIKIALYHGMIRHCEIRDDFVINSPDKKVIDFSGFDYALLGDVHKFQYINPEKTIAYPGSLIQQNISESLDGHGFIEWNLSEKKSIFNEIKNDFGFAKVDFIKNKIQKNIIFPKNIILSVSLSESDKLIVETEIGKLTKHCDTVSILWMKEKVKETKKSMFKSEDLNIETQNELIRKYCAQNNETHEQIEEMISINNEIKSQINELRPDVNHTSWNLVSITFENMFSYGSGNAINFTKYNKNDIIGIIGPNHYGKSSVIDIILFILFDRCSRKIKKQEIMNVEKNTMYCECIIKTSNIFYKIIKKSMRTKKSIKSDIHLSKSSEYNGEYENISIENVSDATSHIEEIVGTYDNFIKCNISLQDGENFVNLKGSAKIEYLKEITSLNIFNDMEEVAKEKKKELTTVINTLTKKNNNRTISNISVALSNEKKILKELMLKKNNLVKDKNELSKKIKQLSQTKINVPIVKEENLADTLTDYMSKLNGEIGKQKTLIEEIDILKSKEEKYKCTFDKHDDIERLQNEYFKLKEKIIYLHEDSLTSNEIIKNNIQFVEMIAKYQEIVSKNKLNNGKLIIQNTRELEENLELLRIKKEKTNKLADKYSNNISLLKEKVITHIKIIKKFDDFEYDENCEYCINNPFTKDAKSKIEKLESLKQKLSKYKLKYSEFEESEINNKYDEAYLLLKQKTEKNKKTKTKIVELKNSTSDALRNIEIYKMKLESSKEKLESFDKNKIIADNNKKINAELDKLNIQLNQLVKEKKDYDYFLSAQISIKNKSAELENVNIKFENIRDKINMIEKKIVEYDSVKDIYEKNKVIDAELSILNKEKSESTKKINKIENDISNQKIEIVKKNIELENCNELLDEINASTAELNNILKYLKIVDKKGLPFSLLSGVIKQIETFTNEYLESMTDFTIAIKDNASTAGYNRIKSSRTSIDIYKCRNNIELNLLSCSGFEKFIIGFTIRLALIDICNKNKPNFIAIDEGFSCMDENNLSNIKNLLQIIKQKFDFSLIISHIDIMKDYCDSYIHVRKNKNGSGDSYIC